MLTLMLTQYNVGGGKKAQCCCLFFPKKKISNLTFQNDNSLVTFESRSYLYTEVPISEMQKEGRRNCQWRVVLYKIK